MIPKEDPELKSCFKQVQGVIINGYDNKKISIRFGEQIRETEALSVEWTNFLEELGIDSSESQELLQEFLNDIL